ncbi:uncharacterized protein LOC144619399 [Crassostrea virginica]
MDNMAYKPQYPETTSAPQNGSPYPPQTQQDPPQTQQYPQQTQYYPQQIQQSSNNLTVVTPGRYQPAIDTTPVARDWTVPAVLALFCFFPTGICAIITAVKARNKYLSGDTEGGRRSSILTRRLFLISVILGLVLNGLMIGTSINNFIK